MKHSIKNGNSKKEGTKGLELAFDKFKLVGKRLGPI
jgi:hypothetical protein